MWKRFTEEAKQAIYFAQEEAKRFWLTEVEPEALLIGIVTDDQNLACRLLGRLGVSRESIREYVQPCFKKASIRPGDTKNMRLSCRAKRAIDAAFNEQRELGDESILTVHLLLGLIRVAETHAGWWTNLKWIFTPGSDGSPTASQVLADFGVDAEIVTQELEKMRTEGYIGEHQEKSQRDSDDSLRGRDVISIADFDETEVRHILLYALHLSSIAPEERAANPILPGRTLAMVFEKPSFCAGVTSEVGIAELGGHCIQPLLTSLVLDSESSVRDAAGYLSKWAHGIVTHGSSQSTILALAEHADVPVINGLSDIEHPCQALADFLTIWKKKGKLEELKIVYIGVGNSICHSLMLLAAKVGAGMVVCCPEGHEPDPAVMAKTEADVLRTGAGIEIVHDPGRAVKDADVIYGGGWVDKSGQNSVLPSFRINQELVGKAKSDAIILHVLPVHHCEDITDEVLYGPNSMVFAQAGNRLLVQKAVMALTM